MRVRAYIASALAFVLCGCASSSTSAQSADSAQTAGAAADTSTDSAGSTEPTGAPTDGADAASALSGFACSPAVGVSQRWTATGTLTNDDSEAASYRVTAVIVTSTGVGGIAAQRLVDVGPGDAIEVDLGRVRGPLDGTCQVQVLRVG